MGREKGGANSTPRPEVHSALRPGPQHPPDPRPPPAATATAGRPASESFPEVEAALLDPQPPARPAATPGRGRQRRSGVAGGERADRGRGEGREERRQLFAAAPPQLPVPPVGVIRVLYYIYIYTYNYNNSQ
jgi:hypothetical protein